MFISNKSSNTTNKIVNDLLHDNTKHFIGKNTFAFAVKFKGVSPELMLDPTYFDFGFYISTYSKDGENMWTVNKTSIGYKECNNDFPFLSSEIHTKLKVDKYLCPNTTDYFVSSNHISDNYSVVEVSLFKCQGSHCKSDQEIDKAIRENWLDILLIDSYFDFSDFENPIKTYLQDLNYVNMLPNMTIHLDYYIKRNEVLRDEGYFINTTPTQSYFYSIGDKQYRVNNFKEFDKSYLYLFFKLSQEHDQYERNRFTFFDMFGVIGGVYEI